MTDTTEDTDLAQHLARAKEAISPAWDILEARYKACPDRDHERPIDVKLLRAVDEALAMIEHAQRMLEG